MMLAFLFSIQDVQELFFLMQIGMIEFIGILNVKVIGGTNLAIRDMSSSDPYVVLTLGRQVISISLPYFQQNKHVFFVLKFHHALVECRKPKLQ